jgi:hypothetical protein
MNIKVRYTCNACGISKREVEVLARTDEDVIVWVEQIMGRAIGCDHAAQSPFCKSTKMTSVEIPVNGVDRVGGAVLQ